MGLELMMLGATIGSYASVYSTVAGGIAQAEQAEFNADMARYQAAQQEANAEAAIQRANAAAKAKDQETDANVANLRRRSAALLAQNRANAGALGFDMTGSNLLFDLEQRENAEMEASEAMRTGRYEASLLRYEGELAAFEHRQQAAVYGAEADMAKAQARNTRNSLWISAPLAAVSGGISGAAAGYQAGEGGAKLWDKFKESDFGKATAEGWGSIFGGKEKTDLWYEPVGWSIK